jgi:hypothetical protein
MILLTCYLFIYFVSIDHYTWYRTSQHTGQVKHLCDRFPVQNGLKQDALLLLLLSSALEHSLSKVQDIQVGLQLIVAYQLLVYVADVHLLGDNIKIIDREAQLDANEGGGLEASRENEVCIPVCCH